MTARKVRITPVLNGFIVKVGCQTVMFDDAEKMGKELARYYADPDAVEKEYLDNATNKPDPASSPYLWMTHNPVFVRGMSALADIHEDAQEEDVQQ